RECGLAGTAALRSRPDRDGGRRRRLFAGAQPAPGRDVDRRRGPLRDRVRVLDDVRQPRRAPSLAGPPRPAGGGDLVKVRRAPGMAAACAALLMTACNGGLQTLGWEQDPIPAGDRLPGDVYGPWFGGPAYYLRWSQGPPAD